MPREYKMRKRADDWQKTRERILKATMQLHDEKGVAPTTFSDIAKRAGLGQATLYRHFPTIGDLVQTCGGHVWQEMRPPTPDTAAAVFEGLTGLGRTARKACRRDRRLLSAWRIAARPRRPGSRAHPRARIFPDGR